MSLNLIKRIIKEQSLSIHHIAKQYGYRDYELDNEGNVLYTNIKTGQKIMHSRYGGWKHGNLDFRMNMFNTKKHGTTPEELIKYLGSPEHG